MVSKSLSAFKSNLRASQLISTSLTSVPEFFRFCSCYIPKSKLSRISRVLPSSRCLIFKVHPLDFLRLFAAFRPLGRPPFFARSLERLTIIPPRGLFVNTFFTIFSKFFAFPRLPPDVVGFFLFGHNTQRPLFPAHKYFRGWAFSFSGKVPAYLSPFPLTYRRRPGEKGGGPCAGSEKNSWALPCGGGRWCCW